LRLLEREEGDIKALEGPLREYYRLRVMGCRVIFGYETQAGSRRVIRCVFAERRSAVYEFFEEALRRRILAQGDEAS
jgi:mRNA-degrading endonuclease RelE of RelBE toxin-antitoxin system